MNKWSLIAVVTGIIIAGVSAGSLYMSNAGSLQDPKGKPDVLPAIFFLEELANKYDCYVTLEEGWEEGGSRNELEGRLVQRGSGQEGLQQELEYLRQVIPYLTYEIKEGSPRVTHLIDTRLLRQEGYGVERILQSIDFEGTINDLITTIGKQGVSITPETSFILGGIEFPDRSTRVNVKGEAVKVRDVLTKFVPVERGRGRILWIARTKLTPGSVTTIYYPWTGAKS